ncbi:hypothetical protein, partial [Teichococcus vastitatis]|uniref:hypothetical protein n=1 Tax=Teichococcus vastitatis TaxID=2307076 RepID=UPI001EE3E63C
HHRQKANDEGGRVKQHAGTSFQQDIRRDWMESTSDAADDERRLPAPNTARDGSGHSALDTGPNVLLTIGIVGIRAARFQPQGRFCRREVSLPCKHCCSHAGHAASIQGG